MSRVFRPPQAVQFAVFGRDDDFSFPVPIQVGQNRRANRAAKIHAPQNRALALVLFQRVKPAIAGPTERFDLAVAIEIGRDKVTDRRFQGKGPADLGGMIGLAKSFIRRTHGAFLRQASAP